MFHLLSASIAVSDHLIGVELDKGARHIFLDDTSIIEMVRLYVQLTFHDCVSVDCTHTRKSHPLSYVFSS
jgi:hypothetical protein